MNPFLPRFVFKTIVLLLFVFCATFTVKAQLTEWIFAYSDGYPHDLWGCPDYGNSPIEVKNAYAVTGGLVLTPNGSSFVFRTIDKNVYATLTKGRMMGGNYSTQNCAYRSWGYGSFKRSQFTQEIIANSSDTVTATFSEPVAGSTIFLTGRYPQTFIITESGRSPVTVDMNPIYDSAGITYGDLTVNLSGKKITGLTVKSTHPEYAFAIDNIKFNRLTPYNPPANNPPPAYCNATAIPRPTPSNISGYSWTMHSEVSDTDGLVLTDIRLLGRLMAEKISIPYYQISTNQTPSQRGELRPNDSSGAMRSHLVSYQTEVNDERLIIKATYAIDNISASQSCMVITQRYEFLRDGLFGPCTPAPGPTQYLIPPLCSRWRASIDYNFKGNNGETLASLNVAKRDHFQVNGFTNNSIGLFKDCDSATGCISSNGVFFERKKNPLFSETYSPVIVNGQQTKLWDNVHQTYRSFVTEPSEHLLSTDFIAGGCPECLHSHWRWGEHFGDHFNSGEPYLPDETNQDLSIAILRNRAGEEHPNNLLDLISFTNPEPIRYKATSAFQAVTEGYYAYSKPEDVVYWSSAIGYKQSDTFFDHYNFFIPSEVNVTRPLSLGPSFAQLKDEESASLAGGDAPTSVVYGFLYADGTTSYSERDPNLIAPLPSGYTHYNNISYDIRTQASVSGPHTVTFNLPTVTNQTTFNNLRILHSEPNQYDPTHAVWVDRTILSPSSPAPDFANKNISAKVNEVGPFVIANLVNPPIINTNIADLSVTVTESADPIVAGNDLVYTINVTNNSAIMATGVALTNGLSPDVNFVSADAGSRYFQEVNGTIIFNIDMIAPGATIPVVITVKPSEGQTRFPATGKSIINSVFVLGNESDPNETNNSVNESTLVLPNPNAPPTAKIQNPATDSILSGLATFSVIVGATDSDGTISQVELFLDGVTAGNGTLAEPGKYRIDLSNVAFGEHSLVAVSTDNGGRKAVSDAVGFFVNGPAVVTLDTPIENTLFGRPANIAITATGTNQSGTVSQVEFFVNGESIGNGVLSGTNQYNRTWSNASAGIHVVRAIATDGNGVKSYSATTKIYVTNSPTVNIATPATGASYPKNSNIAFTANAKDFDGYVSKVEFFNGTTLLGAATLTQGNTFAFTWSGVPAGLYSISAKATDDWGQTTASTPISVTVTNTPPTVSMTSPANGAIFTAPANITISANAADSDGTISKVEFFNGTTLLGSDLVSPYDFSWTNVAAGSYNITTKATDNDGAVTTSSTVAVTVNSVGSALLVVGNTTLSAVDTAIKTRLQNLGLTVVVKSDTTSVSTDATGKKVVIISDSVTPANVNTKFKTVTIPVVTLDPQLFDDMGMCATATTNFGTAATQKSVTITNSTHPMAGGLTGTIQVTSANTTFGWGKLNANAVKIATLTTDATKATDFGYEADIVMPGLTAPSRRVGFFYTVSSTSLTTSGGLLFDNAVKWAAGL
jgi:hypothetical protein